MRQTYHIFVNLGFSSAVAPATLCEFKINTPFALRIFKPTWHQMSAAPEIEAFGQGLLSSIFLYVYMFMLLNIRTPNQITHMHIVLVSKPSKPSLPKPKEAINDYTFSSNPPVMLKQSVTSCRSGLTVSRNIIEVCWKKLAVSAVVMACWMIGRCNWVIVSCRKIELVVCR